MTRKIAGVAAVVMVLAMVWRATGTGSSGEAVVRVERKDLVVDVEATGTLAAVEADRLGPPRIEDIYRFKISSMAPEGEEVEADTPVLVFDTVELMERLQTTTTELESVTKQAEKQRIDLTIREADDTLRIAEAEAKVRTSKMLAERPPELFSSIEHSKSVLDYELATMELESLLREVKASRRAAEAELAGLERDRDRAANKVQEIQTSLAAMTVTAPRAGLVIYTTNWRGEKKKPGDTCWRDTKPIEIPDLSRMLANGEVKEAEAGQVTVGQTVRLRLDAHPDHEYAGTVSKISRIVQKKSFWNPLRVVKLEVSLDQTDPERMRPSMRFSGEIETRRIPDTLVIPLETVQVTSRGPVVLVPSARGVRTIEVVLGARSSSEVEVLEGLDADDRILRTPPPDWSVQ